MQRKICWWFCMKLMSGHAGSLANEASKDGYGVGKRG